MEAEYAFTYSVDHDAFSEPIMLDSHIERSERSVKMWAAIWLEQNIPDDLGWDWIEQIPNLTVELITNK